jgi:hypothetical protein
LIILHGLSNDSAPRTVPDLRLSDQMVAVVRVNESEREVTSR